MNPEKWDPVLHWSFRGDLVLIPYIHLHSLTTFLVASSFTICLCAAERCGSEGESVNWVVINLTLPVSCQMPIPIAGEALESVRLVLKMAKGDLGGSTVLVGNVYETKLYADCDDFPPWVSAKCQPYDRDQTMELTRMWSDVVQYSLILVIVTSLATTQFFIDMTCCSKSQIDIESRRPIDSPEILFQRTSVPTTRPRSRSKPEAIFIHPTQSNLARADAAALELGLSGDTDRVHVNKYDREEAPWVAGAGKQAARILLGSIPRRKMPDTWERDPFLITDDSDSG